MKTVYTDSEKKCHTTDDGTMTAVETDFFDGYCDAVIEGYCYDTSKGYTHIYPWKPTNELFAAQTQYEADRSSLEESYRKGVNSLD